MDKFYIFRATKGKYIISDYDKKRLKHTLSTKEDVIIDIEIERDDIVISFQEALKNKGYIPCL